MKTLAERFWPRVRKRGADECWLLINAAGEEMRDRTAIGLGDGRATHASRVAYALHTGSMPPSTQHVLHSCDNPGCVNPAHLRLGTRSDNMRDAVARRRHFQTAKTHCPRGHPYEWRTCNAGSGRRRVCPICSRAAFERYNARRGPRKRKRAAENRLQLALI